MLSKQVQVPAVFLDTKYFHQRPGLYEQERSQDIEGSDDPTVLSSLIVESLRLEKTSKIIKSNCQSNVTVPAEPCPEEPYPHGF